MSTGGRLMITAVTGAVLATLAATPASAGVASGSCRDGRSSGNFSTTYLNRSGWNVVETFDFRLDNPNGLGNKSNVSVRHYQNVNKYPDTLKYSWDSEDNVRPKVNYEHTPTSTARTVAGKWAHTRFGFVFDNSGADDKCHSDTDNFR
jgi:hypothetical protein